MGWSNWMQRQRGRARRVYADLVRRRSRVRVVIASEPTLASIPIFIVGLFRSGTTLVRYILGSHSNIACPGETTFLADMDRMLNDERSLAGFDAMGFDRSDVLSRARQFVAYFYENYARSRDKARWADKSPTYVDHLDFLAELFPDARFVLVVRNPLDQIHSHTQGGRLRPERLDRYGTTAEDPRILGARYWNEKTLLLLDFANRNPSRCQMIGYEELCEEPEAVSRRLFDFLGEPWQPQVLRFWEFDHDQGLEDSRIRTTRSISVSTGGYLEWPRGMIRACRDIVRDTATSVGYDSGVPEVPGSEP
ncbi:MAG TPA: sulfotransferase [Actinobacteria bacterium]|nr:sulfotransferase [Actinomycetota bacterium]